MNRVSLHNYRVQEYSKIAEFYDLFSENDDLRFYCDIAKQFGEPILDLAAGTGRVTIALIHEGYTVTSLEIEPAMIKIFKKKIADLEKQEQSRVTIVEGNMINFDIGMRFSTVIIPSSFGHAMTTKEQISLLRCVKQHLTPSGIFVLDLFPGGAMPEHSEFENGPVKMGDGRIVSRRGIIDCDYTTQILKLHLTYLVKFTNGETKAIESESSSAIIFNREANLLIKMAGMEVVEEYGAFDRRPYSPDCGRRILLLRSMSE